MFRSPRPPRDWGLALETWCLLALFRVCLFLLPLRALKPILGRSGQESRADERPGVEPALHRIRWALEAAAHRLPGTTTCLARALAGRVLLRRRGLTSTLTLGVAPGVSAHAWLRCGATVVCGGEEAAGFTPIASFADDPELKRVP